ncbi:hypothetical protein B4U79_18117 [Dinothrombium tinctorium]|uniref:Neurotransmitter-gated ion-channel transmembrane domain-containing protein n=1 Tax=Dinothrombium tinctorium TaxID=1965070 RepID=A0A3S3S2H0_9ACAR|nr:hypothetical protein B4U79_18117 [Dinothrombium tinctorium]
MHLHVHSKCFCFLDGYSIDDIQYEWKFDNDMDIELSTFAVVEYKNFTQFLNISTGIYSRIGIEFIIDRHSLGYICRTYIPSALLVIASLLPFRLQAKLFFARLTLSGTILLAHVITMITANSVIVPNIGLTTSLDIYLLVCFLLITASLTLVIFSLSRASNGECGNKEGNLNSGDSFAESSKANRLRTENDTCEKNAMISLALVFLLFNTIYWSICLFVPTFMIS